MLVGQNSRHSDFRLYLNMSYRLFCLLSHWIVNSAVPIQLGTDPAELLKKPCLRVIGDTDLPRVAQGGFVI